MAKKAQINRVIFIVFAAIIVIAAALWGFGAMRSLGGKLDEARYLDFISSVENMASGFYLSSGPGSVSEFSFALPSSVQEVCFIDNDLEYNKLASAELNKARNIYPEENVFLFTGKTYKSYDAEEMHLTKSPLCLLTDFGKIGLKMTSRGTHTEIEGISEERKPECTTVLYNGNSDEKIDIVFLGFGYGSAKNYAEDVNEYVFEHILRFKPFGEEKSKLNFFMIDGEMDIGCEIRDLIRCDNFKVKVEASKCPHDYIIVLASRSRAEDALRHIRSSAVGNIAKINTADNPSVIIHEFGHAFGGLADEYVDERYYSGMSFKAEKYPNCDSQGCDKWSEVENTECLQGCSLNHYFRPTKNSIMRSLQSSEFGPVNEQEIIERLGVYS